MTSISTVQSLITLPTPLPGQMAAALDRLRRSMTQSGPEDFSIEPRLAPTPAERQALVNRVADIDRWMQPAGADLARVEVASILGTMKVRGGNEDDAEAMINIYVADLWNLPAFALAYACKMARTGQLSDGGWAPAAAEIFRCATSALERLKGEKRDIRKVLGARVEVRRQPSEEQRARVARLAAETAEALKTPKEDEPPPPSLHPYLRQREVGRAASGAPIDHSAPVKLSPGARSAYGLAPLPIDPPPPHESIPEERI